MLATYNWADWELLAAMKCRTWVCLLEASSLDGTCTNPDERPAVVVINAAAAPIIVLARVILTR